MKNKLKIKYDIESICEEERDEMESELRSVLEDYGWEWYGEGCEIETKIRDIGFERI